MRIPSIATAAYAPQSPPENAADMRRFLFGELQKISVAITALADGHVDKAHVAPEKPRDGDIRLADGTAWNPGAGQGLYVYYAAAWHFLG